MSHVPYASAIRRLMYAMVCSRLNISHVVGVLRRYMSKLRKDHWIVVKSVFKYLRGTTNHGIYYQGRAGPDKVLDVHGFFNANRAGDMGHIRSTGEYVFNLFGGAISWINKKQDIVALSTTKVEYMATTHASKEAIWL